MASRIHSTSLKKLAVLFFGVCLLCVQVLPMPLSAESCDIESTATSCCEPTQACPCALDAPASSESAPLPAAPASSTVIVKAPMECVSDLFLTLSAPSVSEDSASLRSQLDSPVTAYQGVSLAVAFCSFVI